MHMHRYVNIEFVIISAKHIYMQFFGLNVNFIGKQIYKNMELSTAHICMRIMFDRQHLHICVFRFANIYIYTSI